MILVVAGDVGDEAEAGSLGEEFREEPVFGVLVGAEDEEVRVLAEKGSGGLDVGADGEETAFKGHAVEDGGVADLEGGGWVGEEEDAAEGLIGFAVVHLEKGEAAGVDEGE